MADGNILKKSCRIYEILKIYENLKIDLLVIVKKQWIGGWMEYRVQGKSDFKDFLNQSERLNVAFLITINHWCFTLLMNLLKPFIIVE